MSKLIYFCRSSKIGTTFSVNKQILLYEKTNAYTISWLFETASYRKSSKVKEEANLFFSPWKKSKSFPLMNTSVIETD